jgi:hypothetical protein
MADLTLIKQQNSKTRMTNHVGGRSRRADPAIRAQAGECNRRAKST